ncbi:hypothetical protein [Pseudarthrobacter sp. LT1]|uniref:hypothetical protein n=1 Tax=Pseudarthrobacter sp. LT1 TaxID=3111450 RepID=UPI002D7A226F|nr:hypothetical protein [Pseudarthrobacter sp. LT1]WRT15917.1 hypothetical protein VIK36_10690 [Pseudarthrobacter sp. LT1]
MRPDPEKPAGPAPARASTPVPRRRVRALMILCCALVAALVAGAAAARPGGTDDDVLRGFQIRVLSISQAASENRMDGALAALQALEKDLGEAAAAGRVSAARYRGIEDALSAVRADIATQVAAASAPAAPAPEPAGGAPAPAPALADTAGTGPSPVAPVVEAVAPAPAPAPEAPGSQRSDTAKEAKGKGRSQGKP